MDFSYITRLKLFSILITQTSTIQIQKQAHPYTVLQKIFTCNILTRLTMAFRAMMMMQGLAMVLVATTTLMWTQTAAQSSCTSALTSMSPCLNYITGSSSSPSSTCCSQLSSVVQSSPQCLCSVLNGGSSLGITINQTLALSLPSSCKVQTPPVSQCKAAGNAPTSDPNAPAGSPVGSPEGSIAPSASDIPNAGAGSKTVPTIDGGSSDGSTMRISFYSIFSLLLTASFVSALTC